MGYYEIQVNTSPDRAFGLGFAVLFAVMGAAPLWRGRPVKASAFAVSAGLLLIALVRPALLGGVKRFMNAVTAGLLFFAVITPAGLLLRMLGKDPLRLKPCHRSSYWVHRNPPGPEPNTMTNQF